MKDKPASIEFPLRGVWKFLCPPGHHPLAFDFVKVVEARTYKGSFINTIVGSTLSENYFCWQEPVFSPISGTVIQCSNDWPDHNKNNLIETIKRWYKATYQFKPKEKDGFIDIRPNAGNFVMLKANSGFIVFLAHLKQYSLSVTTGDKVTVGQKIGEVGNSGNSTAPHLHINIFDQMDNPFKAKVLPFIFRHYEELENNNIWYMRHASTPRVKSLVRYKHSTNYGRIIE